MLGVLYSTKYIASMLSDRIISMDGSINYFLLLQYCLHIIAFVLVVAVALIFGSLSGWSHMLYFYVLVLLFCCLLTYWWSIEICHIPIWILPFCDRSGDVPMLVHYIFYPMQVIIVLTKGHSVYMLGVNAKIVAMLILNIFIFILL